MWTVINYNRRETVRQRTFGTKCRKRGIGNYGYEIHNNNPKGI